ncbi:ABC transporter permease [Ruminococcaceae bacterium OttesenSCG-928-A16]|nr:ABC transporter permease [Ruminococcaceae bacterium OttesenSCG-928-A16]
MNEFLAKFGPILLKGTLDTLYMTFVSTFFAYLLGLPCGVLLTTTKKGGIHPAPRFNAIFGWFINIMRSLPFLILMIFIIPATRFIVGKAIGATAGIVPLVVAAVPFIARMVETSLEEVDHGVIEAARCMGATNLQIIMRALLVESIPSLLRGLSISTITILGYTAITGTIGAGGLGDIAYRFGYQRYETNVMYATIVLLIVLVSAIQAFCNLLARRADKRNR